MSQSATTIFRNGSTTYFTASLFFPPRIKQRVVTLYAFVRVADNFVDQTPQDSEGFYGFWTAYTLAREGVATQDETVTAFVALQKEVGIRDEWVDAFFLAMEADLYKKTYHTLRELELYMYGSAEVVGMMLVRCFKLPPASYAAARGLAKAMQYANFLRDLAEDLTMGRQYIPQELLDQYGLLSLERAEVVQHRQAFSRLYRAECNRYISWNKQAEKGFHFLPLQVRVPVAAASSMYLWTVQQILSDPMVVYDRKIKPSKIQVVGAVLVSWGKELFAALPR